MFLFLYEYFRILKLGGKEINVHVEKYFLYKYI